MSTTKGWVIKKGGKYYLKKDDVDPVWTKDINQAIVFDKRPIAKSVDENHLCGFIPEEGETCAKVEIIVREMEPKND